MRSGEVIRRIGEAGWYEVRPSGLYKQSRHPSLPGTVTVPHPKLEIAIGTLKSIEKQSGVRLR